MLPLIHLHIISFFIIFLNLIIFNKNSSSNLGSKYFLINYIYHNHKKISCFIIMYPFVIILIYFLVENIVLVSSFFISILHVYFLRELISQKNITKKEEYIYWYKTNVRHSLSMHTYDMIKKNYDFLSQKSHRAFLFKFEILLFVSVVIESEVLNELFIILDSMK